MGEQRELLKSPKLHDEIWNWIQWINLLTQTEVYYHLDFLFILSTSLYTYLDSLPTVDHKETDDGGQRHSYYEGNKRVSEIQLVTFLVSMCSMVLYFGHKFYLRERRFEIKMHRMVSLLFNHVVQFATIGAIALCQSGQDGQHVDDDYHHNTYNFHCSRSFLAVTYLKLIWHTASMVWALTIRWDYTALGFMIYMRISLTGVLNILEPYIPPETLHRSVLALIKYLECYEKESIMAEEPEDAKLPPVLSPIVEVSAIVASKDNVSPAVAVFESEQPSSGLRYSPGSVFSTIMAGVGWINVCTQSELYCHMQYAFVIATNLYLLSQPVNTFIVGYVLILSISGLSAMLYFGHKFYLRERRFECKMHRIVSLLFIHSVQLGMVVSILTCIRLARQDDDDIIWTNCSRGELFVSYLVVVWHGFCLLWALTAHWRYTWLSLVFYYHICFTGILNIFEPYVSQQLLRKSVVHLNQYLERFESDTVIREGVQ